MPKATEKTTPRTARFLEAIQLLPHVKTYTRGRGRDFWHIGATIDDAIRSRVTASYEMDYTLGEALGKNFTEVLRRFPDETSRLTEYVLKDMMKVGRASGVEFGFIDSVAALVAQGNRAAPTLALVQDTSPPAPVSNRPRQKTSSISSGSWVRHSTYQRACA